MTHELIQVQPFLQSLLLNEQFNYQTFEQLSLDGQLFTIKIIEILNDRINSQDFLSYVKKTEGKFKETQLSNVQLNILHNIAMHLSKASVYEGAAIPDLVKQFNVALIQGTKQQMENSITQHKTTEQPKDEQKQTDDQSKTEEVAQNEDQKIIKEQFKLQFNEFVIDNPYNTNQIQLQKDLIQTKQKQNNEDPDLQIDFYDKTLLFDSANSKTMHFYLTNNIYNEAQLIANAQKISKISDKHLGAEFKLQLYINIINILKYTQFSHEIAQTSVQTIIDQQLSGNILFMLDEYYHHIKALYTLYSPAKWDDCLRSTVIKLMNKGVFDLEEKFMPRFVEIFSCDSGIEDLRKAKLKLEECSSQQCTMCKYLRGQMEKYENVQLQILYQIKNSGNILLLSSHPIKHCDIYHGYCDLNRLEDIAQYLPNERAEIQTKEIPYKYIINAKEKQSSGFDNDQNAQSKFQAKDPIYLHCIKIQKRNIPYVAAINYVRDGVTSIFYIVYNPNEHCVYNPADEIDDQLKQKAVFLSLTPNGDLNIATNLNSLFPFYDIPIVKNGKGLYKIESKAIKTKFCLSFNDKNDADNMIYLQIPESHLSVDVKTTLSSDGRFLFLNYSNGKIATKINDVHQSHIVPRENLVLKRLEVTLVLSNGVQRSKVVEIDFQTSKIETETVLEDFDDPLTIITATSKVLFETMFNGEKLTFEDTQSISLTLWTQKHQRVNTINSDGTEHIPDIKISPYRYANCVVMTIMVKDKLLADHNFQYLVIESTEADNNVKDQQYYLGKTNQFGQYMINLDNKYVDRFILMKIRVQGNSKPAQMKVYIPKLSYTVNRLINNTYTIDPSIQRVIFYSQEKLKEIQINGISRGFTKLEQYVYAFQVEANMFSSTISDMKYINPCNISQKLQEALVVGVTSSNAEFELFRLKVVPKGLLTIEQSVGEQNDLVISKALLLTQTHKSVQVLVPKGFKVHAHTSRSYSNLNYTDHEECLYIAPQFRLLSQWENTQFIVDDLKDDKVYLQHVSREFKNLRQFQAISKPGIALKERKKEFPRIQPMRGRQMTHMKKCANEMEAECLNEVINDFCYDAIDSKPMAMPMMASAAPQMLCTAFRGPMPPGAGMPVQEIRFYNSAGPGLFKKKFSASMQRNAALLQADLRGAKLLMNEASIEGDDYKQAITIYNGTILPYRLKEASIQFQSVEANDYYEILSVNVENSGFSELEITTHGTFYIKRFTVPLYLQNLEQLQPIQAENVQTTIKRQQKRVQLAFKVNIKYSPCIKSIDKHNLPLILESLNISDEKLKVINERFSDDMENIEIESSESLIETLLCLKITKSKYFQRYVNYLLSKADELSQITALLVTAQEGNSATEKLLKNILTLNDFQRLLLFKLHPTEILKNLLKMSQNQVVVDIIKQKLTYPPQSLLSLLLMASFGLGIQEDDQEPTSKEIKGKFTFLADNKEFSQPRGGKVNLIHFIPEKSLPDGAQFIYEIKHGGEIINEFNNICTIKVAENGSIEIGVIILVGKQQKLTFSDKVAIWQQTKQSQKELLREQLKNAQNENKLCNVNIKSLFNYKLSQFEFAAVIFEFYSIKNPSHQEILVNIIDYQINKIFNANIYLICPLIMYWYDQYNYDIEQNYNKYKKQEEKQMTFFLRAHHLSNIIQQENIKEEDLKIKNQEIIKVDSSKFEKIDIYKHIKQYIMNRYNQMYLTVPKLSYIYPQIQKRSLVQQLYQLTHDQQLNNLDETSQQTEYIKHRYQLQFIHSLIHQDYENLFAAAIYSNQYKVAEKCLALCQQKLNSCRFQVLLKYFKEIYMYFDQNNQSFNTHVSESLSRYKHIAELSKTRFSQQNNKENPFFNINKLYLFNQDTKMLLINLKYKNYSPNSKISLYNYNDFIVGKELQLKCEQKEDMIIYQVTQQPKIFLRVDMDLYEIDVPMKSNYKLFQKSFYPNLCYYIVDKNGKVLKGTKIILKNNNREIIKCIITDILGYFCVQPNCKYVYLENGEYVEIQ